MVSLDLSFDRVFSSSLHLWTWQAQGKYFGVPLSILFGWFLPSLTFFAIFFLATKRRTRSSNYAIVFYYLFGLDNVIGDLGSGSPWLALASFIIFTVTTLIIFLFTRNHSKNSLQFIPPPQLYTYPIRN